MTSFQLDIITKTMGIMEERLTLTEDRVSRLIAMQRNGAQKETSTKNNEVPPGHN
jgi:hypothetical protein